MIQRIFKNKEYVKREDYLNSLNKNEVSTYFNYQKHYQKCPLSKFCLYCNDDKNCDFFSRLKTGNWNKCNNNQCINSGYCAELKKAVYDKNSSNELKNHIVSLDDILSLKLKVKTPFYDLSSSYIPRIDPDCGRNTRSQINLIKKNNFQSIFVSPQSLISEIDDRIIKPSYLMDLHNKFDYEGKIFLQTNILDILCHKILNPNNLDKFLHQLSVLKINGMTTFDSNFYLTQPSIITLHQLKRITEANIKLNETGIPLIGLVPPLNLKIFKPYAKYMLESGFKTIAVPLLEINRTKNFHFRDKIIGYLISMKKIYDFKIILLSTNPKIKYPIDCFSSQSWLYKKTKNLETSYKIKQWDENLIYYKKKSKKSMNQQLLY